MSTHNDFLARVANDIIQKYGNDLSNLAIIFPNKRAALYMNEYLASCNNKPIWAPKYYTVGELFSKWSERTIADDIYLICELFKSFSKYQEKDFSETLDHFFGWGQVLLSDFNDIDKSLADARCVFTNIEDLKEYDNIDFLTEEQKAVLERFFDDFDMEHLTKLKRIFLNLWKNMYEIYTDFNSVLNSKHLAYEGSIYREVSEKEDLEYESYKYVFVGIHAPQKAEKKLFDRMQKDGKAVFYWDFDHYYLPEKGKHDKEAGFFMSQLLKEYPNQLNNDDDIYNQWSKPKIINFISASTSAIQAKYVGEWLKKDHKRIADGRRTAVVLCDEKLLPTVTHSIPLDVENLNITVGYPLQLTPAASLLKLLFYIQSVYRRNTKSFKLKTIRAILNHPYSKYISSEAADILNKFIKEKKFFIKTDDLMNDEGMRLLFKDINDIEEADKNAENYNIRLSGWIIEVVKRVATNSDIANPLFKESIFRVYTILNRLHGLMEAGQLDIDFNTYQRLAEQVLSLTKIPYHGEPVVGLQIMGFLETRNLDFDHVLILNCNEGNVPRITDSPSFIPHLIRNAFGLTTMDNHVSIFAYHFYRLLQRAKDITIVYGNITDNNNSGERSRFMAQLLVESGKSIQQYSIENHQDSSRKNRVEVSKDEAVMNILFSMKKLSPTAINRYQRCGLMFFYNYILNIKEPEPDSEEIDNRVFGNLFHDASQYIYDKITGFDRHATDKEHVFDGTGRRISHDMIEWVLKKESGVIEDALNYALAKNYIKGQTNGMNLIVRNVIKKYLRKLLEIDMQASNLTIRGHEGDVFTPIEIQTSTGAHRILLGGRIDRMDEISNADGSDRHIRVVDYKTGSKLPSVSRLDDVFSNEAPDKHGDYFLQVMLYSIIVSESEIINPYHLPVSPALFYIVKAENEKSYDPVISFGPKTDNQKIYDVAIYSNEFKSKLKALLTEIFDPSIPFKPTDKLKRCNTCPYSQICGKYE